MNRRSFISSILAQIESQVAEAGYSAYGWRINETEEEDWNSNLSRIEIITKFRCPCGGPDQVLWAKMRYIVLAVPKG